jgi:hypothetical protein
MMGLYKYIFLIISIANFLVPIRTEAQQGQQTKVWRCLRQPFAETTDGDVMALQCVAALPKDDKLEADDEDILGKLEIIRWNASTYRQLEKEDPKSWSSDKGKGKEMMDAVRMGFGQKVGQICQQHPNIVLAPLFPDLTSGTTTLYGCKNILAVPEN